MRAFDGLGLRGPLRRAPPSMRDIAPDGTNFVEGTVQQCGGTPKLQAVQSRAALADKQLPLIVMLHGCTQSPDDFAAGTRMNFLADAQNCFVVYPEQPSAANQSKCWNWFR